MAEITANSVGQGFPKTSKASLGGSRRKAFRLPLQKQTPREKQRIFFCVVKVKRFVGDAEPYKFVHFLSWTKKFSFSVLFVFCGRVGVPVGKAFRLPLKIQTLRWKQGKTTGRFAVILLTQ